MSAICGLLHRNGAPVDESRLDASLAAMTRYGPDGSGRWVEPTVAFGHQLYALLPESVGEHQPLQLREPRVVITADARIDNREELAESLGLDPAEVRDWSDTRYILAAYVQWGVDCVPRLLGDFAFAIWDDAERRLLLARDCMGIRPLYYALDDERVAFASDVEGGLVVAGLPRHLDPQSLREQLYRGSMQHKERTFFADLRKLPPGYWLTVGPNGARRECYWRAEDVPSFDPGSVDDTVEQVLELVTEATRCRLRSTQGVGAHASGGLDSSTLAVLAARELAPSNRTLTAINWAPPFAESDLPLDPEDDERATIEALAGAEPNLESCYTPLSAEDVVDGWCVDIARNPSTTLRWEYRASKEAASRGVGVVLSGWGGDETIAFNGRGFFADMARKGRWLKLARELHLRSKIHPVVMWGLRRKVIMPLMPDWLLRAVRPDQMRARTNEQVPNCLTPELRGLMESTDPDQRQGRERAGRRYMQEVLINLGHLNHRAESWNDWGANLNVEYRFPVLDKRVVEFALGAPDWLFFHNGWKRYAFRKSMEGLVPADAQWKKRKGDPAMVRGGKEIFEPARKLYRLRLLAREQQVRDSGLLNWDAFLDGHDNDREAAQKVRDGATAATTQGSAQAGWLAFVDGTLAR